MHISNLNTNLASFFNNFLNINDHFKFTATTAISIKLALENFDAKNIKFKWPNDIFVGKKKLGGILCETKINKNKIEKIVIGVGINVNEKISEHPENIRDHLTTMLEISDHAHQRELIAAEFINSIERLLYELSDKPEQIIDKWLNHCLHVNEEISFYENTKIIKGVFCGLNINGFAKIEINNKIKTYGSLSLI